MQARQADKPNKIITNPFCARPNNGRERKSFRGENCDKQNSKRFSIARFVFRRGAAAPSQADGEEAWQEALQCLQDLRAALERYVTREGSAAADRAPPGKMVRTSAALGPGPD